MLSFWKCVMIVTITLMLVSKLSEAKRLNEVDMTLYREKVKKMFYHAYESYLKYAYPYDELQPLTCEGFDTWGSYSLTLIDALDTLAVIGNNSEFRRVANIVIDKGETIFDMDINVSVFETNIRIVGGLLSAHLLMKRTGMQLEPAWPCSGPLLRMAESIARRLLPAFDTPTGMPYGTVNLRSGVPKGETTITCTAGVGTFIVEFGSLSRLTGDPIFEKTAIRAIRSLWKFRSPLGLLGNHIDVATGKWTALDSGIGGGIDSYFEYLVKGSILFNLPELVYLFRDYEEPIKKYLKRDDWYMWAHMNKGSISLPMFTSLDAFWPGIQALLGDIEPAMKTLHNFQQVWHQFGGTPEYYNIPKAEVHKGREGYPLRPELIESIMYLYRSTKDPVLLEMGVEIVEAIERIARTSCGYATVKDVRDHRLEDRMESFFLAETTKYLYLLFDPDNFIHNNGSHGTLVNTPSGSCVIEAGGYVFNTEAHPIDLASVYCCSAEKQEADRKLEAFHTNIDLLTLTGLVEDVDELKDLDWPDRKRKRGREKHSQELEEDEEDEESVEEMFEDKIFDSSLEEGMGNDLLHRKQIDNDDAEDPADKEAGSMKDVDVIGENIDKIMHGEGEIHDFTQQKENQVEIETQEKCEHCSKEDSSIIDAEKKKYLPQGKGLQGIELTGLSDMKKGVEKIFLDQLDLDSDIVDVSLKIGQKMGSDFKGTEFEKVAEFVSKQLMQVKNMNEKENSLSENMEIDVENSDAHKSEYNEKTKTENIKDAPDSIEVEVEDDDSDEVSFEDGFETDEEENLIKPEEFINESEKSEEKRVTSGKDNSQTDQQTIILLERSLSKDSKDEQNAQSEDTKSADQRNMDGKDAHLDSALQRLKHHLEAQLLQQYKQTSIRNNEGTDGKLSSLESKRANILSLTAKLFKLFARGLTGGDSDDDDSGKVSKPSLAGLYKSLAGYPLQYFHDPHMMHCPAQSFHSRLSVYGEMFQE